MRRRRVGASAHRFVGRFRLRRRGNIPFRHNERGDRMYGLTRATTTLIAAGAAGLLIWIATQISNDNTGGYWARIGLVAGAGFVMALSQLLGGWTKWGVPRLSIPVLLTVFVPVAI